ncbi:helix-turn-helix domain-containing protein [Paenibacillus amylolyticus]|nr:helix-turn-helix domain-containing protein [Paenibacillus amylolyticus]
MFKLLGEPGHIKMEDLADQLYISRATMNNDLKIIRQILENYQLQLQIKPGHGVKVVGDEQRFRYCLAEYADARDEELGPEGMTAAQERLLYPIGTCAHPRNRYSPCRPTGCSHCRCGTERFDYASGCYGIAY